jgi:hypothetical protein
MASELMSVSIKLVKSVKEHPFNWSTYKKHQKRRVFDEKIRIFKIDDFYQA